MIDNTTQGTLQLARLNLALHEIQQRISGEILPALAFLQSPEDELTQTLELTVSAIEDHFKNYRLQAIERTREDS